MKLVKGVTIFLVLCLAAYGALTLLKKPPQLGVSEKDRAYLEAIGIDIQGDGTESITGLSSIFGEPDGVAPVGGISASSTSSTPPSFLVEPTTSSMAPPFIEAVPRIAASSSEFSAPPVDVFPPPNFVEPVDSPIPAPSVELPFPEIPPAPASESPPPWEESWDGPASDILTVSPPTELLQPLITPLGSNPPIETLGSENFIREKSVSPSGGISVRRIEPDESSREMAVSTVNSLPIVSPTVASSPIVPSPVVPAPVQYTQTSARKSLTFEPVKPDALSNSPIVAFAPPKRTHAPQQLEPLQPQQPDAAHLATANLAVRQIETPRPIDVPSVQPLAVQTPIQETVERLLAESSEPERIRLAFIEMSQLYESNQINEAERAMIQPILDTLAIKVIYARDTHILESPYHVTSGETVESVARKFNLNPAFLRKINGLLLSQELSAGTVLKVVHGQFDARISVKRKELTLLLGGLYAGRFPFTLPHAGIPVQSGEFFVASRTDRSLELNNGWTLATASVGNAAIVFADHAAREIFDILSEQSVIVLEL